MKTLLLLVISFAFALSVIDAQGYARRRRPKEPIHPKPIMPIHPKPIAPKPMHPKPMNSLGGLSALRSQRQFRGGLPPSIMDLLGKTITGKDIIGGVGNFPRHGGAGIGEQFKDGLRNGWGGDPSLPMHQAVSGWVDPLENRPFSHDFNGGDLVYDRNRGMYMPAVVQHQAAKMSTGGSGMAQHNIVKEAQHIADKTISGVGGAGGHMVAKETDHIIRKTSGGHHIGMSSLGNGGMLGGHHNVGKATMGVDQVASHNFVKATSGGSAGVAFVNPGGPIASQHNIAKSSGRGFIGGGMQHDIAKATSVVDPFGPVGPIGGGSIGHDIAKATSAVDPFGPGMGHIGGGSIGHDIAKATSAVDPFAPGMGPIGSGSIGHDIAKATSGIDPWGVQTGMVGGGILPPHQVKKASGNPVHNVDKVVRSGMASVGHDDLAFNLGSNMAREVTHNSAKTIDMGSGGAVSGGSILANRAVQGLAREALHVAKETLDIASGNPGHFGQHGGSSVHGGGMIGLGGSGMMHPKPVLPKKPIAPKPFPTNGGGYGRTRTRGVRAW